MKIKISPVFWLGWVLMILTGNAPSVPALFLCASIHELSHFAAFRLFRLHVTELRVLPFGLAVRIDTTRSVSYCTEFFCVLAGPIANLVCAALFHVLPMAGTTHLVRYSLILGLFNLLPVLPLDGGRALQAGLLCFLRETSGRQISYFISCMTAFLLFFLSVSTFFDGSGNLSMMVITLYLLRFLLFGQNVL